MTNESILTIHLELIRTRRAAGISWNAIGDELRTIGVTSAAGVPFNAAALRAYWTRLREHGADEGPVTRQSFNLSSEEPTNTSQQAEELARLAVRYLTTRLFWIFDIWMQRSKGVVPEVDHLRDALDLLDEIRCESSDIANRADKAGSILSQLFLSMAGLRGVTVNREDLNMLLLPAAELDRQMRQQEAEFEARVTEAMNKTAARS